MNPFQIAAITLLTIDCLYFCVVKIIDIANEDWIQDFKHWNEDNLEHFK